MRPKFVLFFLAGGLAVAALFFAFREHRARREAQAALEGHWQRQAEITAGIGVAQQRLATVEGEQRRVREALEAQRRKAAESTTRLVRTAAPLPPQIAAFRDAMFNDPKAQNIHLADVRSRLTESYRVLCDEFHLTEAQAKQLIENLVKRYTLQLDLGVAAENQASRPSDAAVTVMRQQVDDEHRAAQRALLGEAGFQKFEAYARTIDVRRWVDEFAGRATLAGAPITGAQADAMIDAMAKASPLFQSGRAASMQAIDWGKVLDAMSTVLPESQFKVFKNSVIQGLNRDRLNKLARQK